MIAGGILLVATCFDLSSLSLIRCGGSRRVIVMGEDKECPWLGDHI